MRLSTHACLAILFVVGLLSACPTSALASEPVLEGAVWHPAVTAAVSSTKARLHTFPTVVRTVARAEARTPKESVYYPVLSYHGGGVITSPPQIYLDFWGPAWQQGFDVVGVNNSQIQNYVEQMFKVGLSGSDWANIHSEYCSGVPVGTSQCPASNSQRIQNPGGFNGQGQVAGVWLDPSTQPDWHNCGTIECADVGVQAEAKAAAAHFGGLAPGGMVAVILPPCDFAAERTGLPACPPGFASAWCAYHGFDGSEPYMLIPFIPFAFKSCGANWINKETDAFGHGVLDGYSTTGFHEYSEILTDYDVETGWFDSVIGFENSDICAWTRGGNVNGFATQSDPTQFGFPASVPGHYSCTLGVPIGDGSYVTLGPDLQDVGSHGAPITVTQPAFGRGCPAQVFDPACGQSWTFAYYQPGQTFTALGYVDRPDGRWFYFDAGINRFGAQGYGWLSGAAARLS